LRIVVGDAGQPDWGAVREFGDKRQIATHLEDLVADMPGQMRRIYQTLELGEFDRVLPAIRQYVAARAGYRTNRYQIPLEMRERVSRRWAALARGEFTCR
jgi:hypothetical protein